MDTQIDRETMGKLASTLAFLRGPEDKTVVALRLAATTGTARDIKAARTAFLKLKGTDRQSALATLVD